MKNIMRRHLKLFIFLGFLVGCAKKRDTVETRDRSSVSPSASLHAVPSASGQFVPDFDGTLLSGEKFHLADHFGKDTVILNFFTTWCGPCRIEFPALNEYYAQSKGKGVVLLGIDAVENQELVKSFVQNESIAFPVLVDGGDLSKALGVSLYPTTIVIGVDGTIQFQKTDPVDPERELDPYVKAGQERLQKETVPPPPMGSTLHVSPPEIKPVAGAAVPNQIYSICVVKELPEAVQVEVDYSYSGDHGNQRIYVDCQIIAGAAGSPFVMRPIVAEVGRHTAQTNLGSYEGTPANILSSSINCVINSRIDYTNLTSNAIPYAKVWKKQ